MQEEDPQTNKSCLKFEPILGHCMSFNQLTDLLFEMMKEKHSMRSRLLGISRIHLEKWERNPPRQWWWNLVLRAIIKEYLSAVQARRGSQDPTGCGSVMDLAAKIPQAESWAMR
jgi:hypothetical protein